MTQQNPFQLQTKEYAEMMDSWISFNRSRRMPTIQLKFKKDSAGGAFRACSEILVHTYENAGGAVSWDLVRKWVAESINAENVAAIVFGDPLDKAEAVKEVTMKLTDFVKSEAGHGELATKGYGQTFSNAITTAIVVGDHFKSKAIFVSVREIIGKMVILHECSIKGFDLFKAVLKFPDFVSNVATLREKFLHDDLKHAVDKLSWIMHGMGWLLK